MTETTLIPDKDLADDSMTEDGYINQSAHLLGNYHKYYTFHSAQSRIDQLQHKSIFLNLWKSLDEPSVFHLMDIGCNEGDLSIALWNLVKSELPAHVQCRVVGVDIDKALTDLGNEKAKEFNQFSAQKNVIFDCVDFTKEDQITQLRNTLKEQHDITHFHLITVFSTTMWIHINGGDEGLERFLLSAKEFLVEKGVLLVEPQPGRCYTNAAKRCRKLGLTPPPFLHVVDRTKADETLTKIIQNKLELRSLDFIGQEVWGRSIYLFHNNESFHTAIAPNTLPKIDVPPMSLPKSKKKKLVHNEHSTEANDK